MNWPNVGIIIPTYNRASILQECVLHLRENLKYHGQCEIFVGNDGDEKILESFPGMTVLEGPRRGLGANLNNLLQTAWYDCPVVLQMDDDHLLVKELDITWHVDKLIKDESIGCIRLMGIAGHHYSADLEESYWNIRWDSPELYVASNRPHLKHFRFHTSFGYYPESLKLGDTESSFCAQCKDVFQMMGGPKVLIPLDVLTESSWKHVGDSWQAKGF